MRVFVTGGSGFIGEHVVRALLDRGHEVVCMSRSGEASARLAALGAGVVGGDLTDSVALERCLREAAPTHVAHLAATSLEKSEKACKEVNVDGTRALIDTCLPLGLERFLFVSSVLRGQAAGETFTETDHIPATTALGRSKEAGDRMVVDAFAEHGFPGVILRPSRVYGAGGWLRRTLAEKGFRLPGDGGNWWDLVHVEDVASACALLLERGEAGEAYHVCDDYPVTMKQFFALVADAGGRKPFGHVPSWLQKVKSSSPVTAATRSARSSNAKLKELGWSLRFPNSADAIGGVVAEIVSAGTRERADTEVDAHDDAHDAIGDAPPGRADTDVDAAPAAIASDDPTAAGA